MHLTVEFTFTHIRPMHIKTILTILSVAVSLPALAQKKPLDHSVYDSWKHVANAQISRFGHVIAYEVQPQEGDGKLVITQPGSKKQIIVPRGYNARIFPDERYLVCLIKPFFQATRKAKIDKVKKEKMPADSLAVISLNNGQIKKFADVESFKTGKEGTEIIAFLLKKTGDDKKKKDTGKPLVFYYPATGKSDTIQSVNQYRISTSGKLVAYTASEDKTRKAVGIYHTNGFKNQVLEKGMPFYTLPRFDKQETQVLFLASKDTLKTGTKHCEVYYHNLTNGTKRTIDYTSQNANGNQAVNEYGNPFFSADGKRIFAGTAPVIAPDDTTLVSFETPGLDIWNYQLPTLPPEQKANLERERKKTYLSIYAASTGKFIPLAVNPYESLRLPDEGKAGYALSVDRTRHYMERQWDMQIPVDIAMVSLEDGARKAVASGKFTRIEASPDGKYILWYDLELSQWYCYNTTSGTTASLTARIPVRFYDELNDTPEMPEPYGTAGWTNGSKAVLLYDRYDIWQIAPDGSSFVNLTKGEGRKNKRTYSYQRTDNEEDRIPYAEESENIKSGTKIWLSVFDHTTKENGFASLVTGKPQSPATRLDKYAFRFFRKAEKAEAFIYTRENFQTCRDLCYTKSPLKGEQRLSDTNPQMKDYSWGTAELYKWTAFDGTPMEGLLYKPEGFSENRKYPVMIYFYERRSENLYTYYEPAPSRSTINISFYCSRGYVVFVPDIVYKAGIPGECAYNCIVSGAESLAKNPWIDKKHMAIQGQSWGGYQTAYLITRTNLFKAAGAGAPVSNMTSAYGGIRWKSGMSRQFQYEHTQSRIGRTLWEAPELYISNSPVFKADRVTTPVLIMHNDNDGAVPWYQGIEFFMGLRRLGKPAWLLQYNNEEHNLVERRNCKDLSIRLQQFFDFYLKSAPEPAWMKTGVPTIRKGQYFGYETDK